MRHLQTFFIVADSVVRRAEFGRMPLIFWTSLCACTEKRGNVKYRSVDVGDHLSIGEEI